MDTSDNLEQSTQLLQQLGLTEYEAKCFVGLSRVSSATAKEIAEITDVPRTRVYDAVRVLEAKGLVEVQHSSPQQFRAVPLEEATETLRDQFEDRIDTLTTSLEAIDRASLDEESVVQEIWALEGTEAVANRTRQLLEEAQQEVVLVVGEEALLTDELFDVLESVPDDVHLIVGAVTESISDRIAERLPEATVFVSGLDWLREADEPLPDTVRHRDTAVGRLLLVDRSTILLSSYEPDTGVERAVFGRGFGNGLVVVARRLLATGLVPVREVGAQ